MTVHEHVCAHSPCTVHHSCQQCLLAEWLGLSVTVRFRVRARIVLSVLKVTNTSVLHVNSSAATFMV